MHSNNTLKLFLSYSHDDEKPYVEQFRKHIAPLKEKDLIDDWYDRKIFGGQNFQSKIDNNLEEADIVCLFISSNFLSSTNCMKEKQQALEYTLKSGIRVFPIILSPCGWLDNNDIAQLLSFPTDGKPITKFQDRNEGWQDVYAGLKEVIQDIKKVKNLRLTEKCENFLQDTEMLKKAHSKKEQVFLDDTFVYPDIDTFDELRKYEETLNSKKLIENLLEHKQIAIAGEGQSSKTTLCKKIFIELRRSNFVLIYITDPKTGFSGKLENRVVQSFKEQYRELEFGEVDQERVVPIIDDFHFVKDKEKYIRDLSNFPHCVITIDDIFSLNIKDEKLIRSFDYYKIKEFKPSLRYRLIKKWVTLGNNKTTGGLTDNSIYHDIDKTIELVDTTLGKTIGKGIMPSYPFFILSTIVTYDTFAMPLDQEITSQGYCYQAFIYFYLRKHGVKNDEIDIYINFLEELSFHQFQVEKTELSLEEFQEFMNKYGSSEKELLEIDHAI